MSKNKEEWKTTITIKGDFVKEAIEALNDEISRRNGFPMKPTGAILWMLKQIELDKVSFNA